MLFDRLAISVGEPADTASLLVVGGGGGVGSIAIQLARHLTGLTVISTASRPETRAWSLKMGAHHVVDHRRSIAEQVKAIVPQGVNYVLAMTHTGVLRGVRSRFKRGQKISETWASHSSSTP
jgi:NADPH:quinone reductase-like Zn-dependent oxidoreductase